LESNKNEPVRQIDSEKTKDAHIGQRAESCQIAAKRSTQTKTVGFQRDECYGSELNGTTLAAV